MKRIILLIFILSLWLIPFGVLATSKSVVFESCIDGDTAKFRDQDKILKVRFLAIDTPESTNKVEPYGKAASTYTCQRIKQANNIILEFDPNSDLKDKYDRYLAWVFVDDKLLQKDIVQNGYGKVAYLYGDYKYTDQLKIAQKEAQQAKLRIWQDTTNSYPFGWLLLIFGMFLLGLLLKKYFGLKLNKKHYKLLIKALKKI